MHKAAAPLQTDLFASGPVGLAAHAPERCWLNATSWYELTRGWVCGGDELFFALRDTLPWHESTRKMYERVVDVPRLTAMLRRGDPQVPSIVHDMGRHLSERYQADLEIDMAAYYRDGSDSVAWHADRIDKTRSDHTSAIVSLGGPRRFLLRKKGGGPARSITLVSGDLLVLGGAIQHHFEHCVPKARAAAPRISLLAFGGLDDKLGQESFRLVDSLTGQARTD